MMNNMKKTVISLGLTVMVLLSAGCGKENVASDGENVVEAQGTELVAEPVKSEVVETDMPYAEQNGFDFCAIREWSAPYYTYYRDETSEDLVEIDVTGWSMEHDDAEYKIEDITVSDVDENGMVTVTIPYTIYASYDMVADLQTVDPNVTVYPSYEVGTIGLFDYYTGKTIPSKNDAQVGELYEYVAEYTYEDQTYDIAYVFESTSNFQTQQKTSEDSNKVIFEDAGEIPVCMTILMPCDYDGLCLYFDTKGMTQKVENEDAEYSESEPFMETLESGESLEDYYFMRLSDLM